MTQITATLAKGADPNLIRQIFENVKGVIATSIVIKKDGENTNETLLETQPLSLEKKEWLDKLNRLYHNVDRENVDLNDERSQYILSK